MRVNIEIAPYELPLRIPMRTSSAAPGKRHGLIVRVRDDLGAVGVGEAAPLDARELGRARDVLGVAATTSHEIRDTSCERGALLSFIAETVAGCLEPTAPPSARCGLETALLDLLARRQRRSVAELLGSRAHPSVEVNALITDEEPVDVGQRAADLFARGFRILKLKVGNPDTDLGRIRSVLTAAGGSDTSSDLGPDDAGVTLRLDANRRWDFASAASVLGAIEGMPIDYVEEPLADPIAPALARLRRTSLVGIALDESVSTPTDFERYASAGACDVLVLKLQHVGGPSAALRLAAMARDKSMRVVLTDSLETAVGRAATLHCAAACTAEAVGLAGAFLLSADGSGHDRPSVDLAGPGLGVVTGS